MRNLTFHFQSIKLFWKKIDKGILLSLLIGCIAVWPFFTNPGLPRATDAELHIFRIAELGYSLRAGNLYPRWAPNFYHGYGYPIFNYYAPLTYHLANWLTLFSPEQAAIGAKMLFIGSSLLGALGAYLLGKEFGKQGGGLLGSAAFVFAPYIMLLNPHMRGDLAEVFAVALIPLSLWSWEKLWCSGSRLSFSLAVASTAAVLLSHNLTGLTLMILLLLLCLWHWLILKQSEQFKWGLLAGVLVLLLTAYFWLPFLLESEYIQLDVAGDGHYDFRNHFILLRELTSPLLPMDWRDSTIRAPMSVGTFILILAIFGFFISFRRKSGLSRLLIYAFLGILLFFLITPASMKVWESVPGLLYYQFPWRFLGPLAAILVPLVASIGSSVSTNSYRASVLAAGFCLIIITAIPGLYPLPWESGFDQLTPIAYLETELMGRWRGTTSTNDFVPVTVEMIPEPQDSVLASYKAPPVDRVNRYTLPSDTNVKVIESVPWHNHFEIQTTEKFILRLYIFHFPGWVAYLDDIEVPIEIANPEGFITLEIPPGYHEVVLQFKDTFPRKLGWGIAFAGALIFFAVWVRFLPISSHNSVKNINDPSLKHIVWAIIILIVLKVCIFDPFDWFHYRSPPGEAWAAQYPHFTDFGGEISLLGFDLSHNVLDAGARLDVTLYWNVQHPLTETYQSFVHLVRPEGTIWVQSDHLNPAGFPTNLWEVERYVRDKHQLELPSDLPTGEYTISVGLYTLHNDQRLSVEEDTQSGGRGDNLILSKTIYVRE